MPPDWLFAPRSMVVLLRISERCEMSWLSVFLQQVAADELADCGGDAYRADDEHDERACDKFGAQREPVETVEEEFGEGLMLGFERSGFAAVRAADSAFALALLAALAAFAAAFSAFVVFVAFVALAAGLPDWALCAGASDAALAAAPVGAPPPMRASEVVSLGVRGLFGPFGPV